MASAKCGWDSAPGGASGQLMLAAYGPTFIVDIGFDPAFKGVPHPPPAPGLGRINALVDTGAAVSCIDSMLAAQLKLPIIDRNLISGSQGAHVVNVHLAQVFVPPLNFWFYGRFAGVHLAAGGQWHRALLGRDFLMHFTMTYEGCTGTVVVHND